MKLPRGPKLLRKLPLRNLLLLGVCLLTMRPVAAQPVLSCPAGLPLFREIHSSRAAIIARQETDGNGWRIVAVLHDSTGQVLIGQQIDPRPLPTASSLGLAVIISHTNSTVGSYACSLAAYQYLQHLPARQALTNERIAYAIAHLPVSDTLVAADAAATLSICSLAELETFRTRLPVGQLESLLDREGVSNEQLGLYALLLGLSTHGAAVPALEARIFQQPPDLGVGLDGLTAGYLLLTGNNGLANLETQVLLTNKYDPSQLAAVLRGLELLRNSRLGPSRERLQQTVLVALNHRPTADLAIGYFEAGAEWNVTSQVVSLLQTVDQTRDLDRAVQVACTRFLLTCRLARSAAPAERSLANETLLHLSQTDPDLLRRATLLHSPAQAN